MSREPHTPLSDMGFVIGIDTGGTFTDCVVIDGDGRIVTAKASSTPGDFSEGVMESLRLAGEKLGLPTEALLRDTDRLALTSHGQALEDERMGLFRRVPVALPGTTRPIGIAVRDTGSPSPDLAAVLQALRDAAGPSRS